MKFFITFAAMKKALRNILFFAVALLYIISTMGLGVHKCTDEGTASLILLFGETPCEWVHTHVDSEGNSYTHSHAPGEHHPHHCNGGDDTGHCSGEHDYCCADEHSSNCCSTSVYTITHDQNTTEDFQVSVPQPLEIGFMFQPADAVILSAATCALSGIPSTGQTVVQLGSRQALMCTFRS